LLVGAVGRNAKHDRTGLLNLLVCVAEPARFYRSTRSVGLGKEKQHNRLER
jgi:hypothetical protein